jgi:hypothetical protein
VCIGVDECREAHLGETGFPAAFRARTARHGACSSSQCWPARAAGEGRGGNMLWTIFVILAVLWLLGMVSSYTMGGAIHILLVLAVIVLVLNLLGGRRVLN